MTPTDRADLLARLEAGRAELLASIEGMTDTEAAAAPANGRWSAIANIEHLALVEANLMRGIQSATIVEGESVPGREAGIFEAVRRRQRKFSAPPAAQPTGECQTLAEAISKFDGVRSGTTAYVEGCDRDLRLCPTTHPLMGPLTAMECLYLIAGHPFRHAAQIRELRAGTF